MKNKKNTLPSMPNLSVPAIRGRVLGVNVYRGFAGLSDLAMLSKADIYDQGKNPKGTQRDLSSKHAREAHEYVKSRDLGFWPEVFLCARLKRSTTFTPINDETPDLGMLEFNTSAINKAKKIALSRVDGNHRLQLADGKTKGYSKIEKLVSFCVAYDLSVDDEIQLFKDINLNQKPMNTSHLDGIEIRLSAEEQLKRRNPQLFIAQKLAEDPKSVFSKRIYFGGKRPAGVDIPLRGLKTGIEYMLSRSSQLPRLEDTEAQYRVIRNYFAAFKKWQPKSWSEPKEYITLRGAGLWAVCFIGAHVIDRVLSQDNFDVGIMFEILKSGKDWDWSKKGDFQGFSGRGGALEIARKVSSKLHDEKRMSTKDLFKKIMAEHDS